MYSMCMPLATNIVAFSIIAVLEMQDCMSIFARYNNYTNDKRGKQSAVCGVNLLGYIFFCKHNHY